MKSIRKNSSLNLSQILLISIISLFLLLPSSALSQETYRFIRLWPTLQQPWYFNQPNHIVTDNEGFVYVLEKSLFSDTHHIRKFTADGHFVAKWGNADGQGKLNMPNGIAVDNRGFLYVGDDNYILKFTTDGVFVTQWPYYEKDLVPEGQATITPIGIAADDDGFVYAFIPEASHTSTGGHIRKFTIDGEALSEWDIEKETSEAQEFDFYSGIAVDRRGAVYVIDRKKSSVKKFDPDTFSLLAQWNIQGKGAGIAIDRDGFVYVTDKENHQIIKFTPAGQIETKWGSEGDGDGEFDSPHGISVNRDGLVYVADLYNNRIQKFTSSGRFLAKWAGYGSGRGELHNPMGIAVDDENEFIYVSDTENHRVQKFTQEGQFVEWGNPETQQFDSPHGVTVGPDGSVYVVDRTADCVWQFDSAGNVIRKWGGSDDAAVQFNRPDDVAVDKDGVVYVSDSKNDKIWKFAADGSVIIWGELGDGRREFRTPLGVATHYDADDDRVCLYVADSNNHRIQKFDSSGNFITKWGTFGNSPEAFDSPSGVEVDSEGFVYVADDYNHRIQKFTKDGEFVTAFGQEGHGIGLFKNPYALCVSKEGMVYVADSKNNRIQVYKPIDLSEDISRAIIVAGGGPYPGNKLWDATRMCASFAYRALTYQGFNELPVSEPTLPSDETQTDEPPETIYYLTSDTQLDLDGDGEPDVYGEANLDNLEKTIGKISRPDTKDVILYFVNHGATDSFLMNERETLSVSDLNGWLTPLQDAISGQLIIVYDACKAGSFLPSLSSEGRIVIASTSPEQEAHFLNQGSLSFSHFFWSSIFNGGHLGDAYLAGKAISNITSLQTPQIDTDGDRQPNEPEDQTSISIGNMAAIHWEPPKIDHASYDAASNILRAMVTDEDGIARVWAVIIPPEYHQHSEEKPVLELPSVDLLLGAGNQYEISDYDGFNSEGCRVAVYARDRKGNTSIYEALAELPTGVSLRSRAIIVGGYSAERGDSVEKNLELAHKALKFQGYTDDDIYFMTQETSSTGVDGTSILSNLSYALEEWAMQNTYGLLLYLAGEGEPERFHISEDEFLPISDLDEKLDRLQENMPGMITVICDTDYSGSFVPLLKPPTGKYRIVISSTSIGQSTYISDGAISFSDLFWKEVLNGVNIRDAFRNVREAIRFLSGNHYQSPRLDDNGNGVGNELSDGRLARKHTIGLGIRLASDDPVVTPILVKDGSISVEKVTPIKGKVEEVWAIITPPARNFELFSETEEPLQLLPDENGRYEETYNFPTFGDYQVTIYAKDQEGNASLAKETSIYHQPSGKDPYEPDNNSAQASLTIINHKTPQHHNFHNGSDEDWVRFYGFDQEAYTIKATGANCGAIIELYDPLSDTPMEWVYDPLSDTPIHTAEEILEWTFENEKTDIYYVRLTKNDSCQDETYDLEINLSTGGFGERDIFNFQVIDSVSEKEPILVETATLEFTDIDDNDNNCTVKPPPSDGLYTISAKPGFFEVTVSATGYVEREYEISLEERSAGREYGHIEQFYLDPDMCPDDPNKTDPGICGCGSPETNSDSDEAPDCEDQCPYDSTKIEPGECGCSNPDTDSNGNGTSDCKEHSADYNPQNYMISLSELLRAQQLYTIGTYHCDIKGEDGYGTEGDPDHSCKPHNLDYNPQDWNINLSEFLRLIQFYNSGGYSPNPDGEDGFLPKQSKAANP